MMVWYERRREAALFLLSCVMFWGGGALYEVICEEKGNVPFLYM